MRKNEEWSYVEGSPEYRVSNQGRVYSFKSNRLLSCARGGTGYPQVRIDNRSRKVHQLVLESFVGPCPDGFECDHKNGIRHDNRLENLHWVTRQENMLNRRNHGTHNVVKGERNHTAKLTESDVRDIRTMISWGIPCTGIADMYGMKSQSIDAIKHRKSWAYLDSIKESAK